jgi:hypothetical protein
MQKMFINNSPIAKCTEERQLKTKSPRKVEKISLEGGELKFFNFNREVPWHLKYPWRQRKVALA